MNRTFCSKQVLLSDTVIKLNFIGFFKLSDVLKTFFFVKFMSVRLLLPFGVASPVSLSMTSVSAFSIKLSAT